MATTPAPDAFRFSDDGPEPAMSAADAATLLEVTAAQLERWTARGLLRSSRARGEWNVSVADVCVLHQARTGIPAGDTFDDLATAHQLAGRCHELGRCRPLDPDDIDAGLWPTPR